MKNDNDFLLKQLRFFIYAAVLICFLILGCSFHQTMMNQKMYALPICLESNCISFMAKKMEGTINLAQALGWLVTLLTGLGGAYIALKTYVTGIKNSNITNHISHINMFRDFVNLEVSKRKRVSPSSVDIYIWYNKIFPNSKKGDLVFCSSYLESIKDVKKVIDDANNNIISLNGDYKYKEHQQKMIACLKVFGVDINRGPKNSFVEIEGEILEIIDSVNSTFISGHDLLCLIERKYN